MSILQSPDSREPARRAHLLAEQNADLRERLEGTEEAFGEISEWLCAALAALGVETVFDIPGWREHRCPDCDCGAQQKEAKS